MGEPDTGGHVSVPHHGKNWFRSPTLYISIQNRHSCTHRINMSNNDYDEEGNNGALLLEQDKAKERRERALRC